MTRSVFSLWLCLVAVFIPSLAVELLRPFNAAYHFLSAVLVGPLLYLLFRLLCRSAEKGALLTRLENITGRRFIRVVTIFYLLFGVLLLTLLIEDFGGRIVHSLMLHSDARFYNMTLLIVAAIFSRGKAQTLGRMAEILCPIFGVFILFLSLPILLTASDVGIFPIPKESIAQAIPGGLFVTLLLSGGGLLFCCEEKIAITAHTKKQCLYTAFFTAVYALLIPLLTVLLLGRFLTEETGSSLFLGLRQFKLFGTISNPHILIILPWMMLAIIVCAFLLRCITQLQKKVFPQLGDTPASILSPFWVLLFLALRNEWNPHLSQWLQFGILPLGLLLFYVVPLWVNFLDRQKSRPPSEDC